MAAPRYSCDTCVHMHMYRYGSLHGSVLGLTAVRADGTVRVVRRDVHTLRVVGAMALPWAHSLIHQPWRHVAGAGHAVNHAEGQRRLRLEAAVHRFRGHTGSRHCTSPCMPLL